MCRKRSKQWIRYHYWCMVKQVTCHLVYDEKLQAQSSWIVTELRICSEFLCGVDEIIQNLRIMNVPIHVHMYVCMYRINHHLLASPLYYLFVMRSGCICAVVIVNAFTSRISPFNGIWKNYSYINKDGKLVPKYWVYI